jgi:hypothetical protein
MELRQQEPNRWQPIKACSSTDSSHTVCVHPVKILHSQVEQKAAAAQVLAKGLASMAPSAEYRVDPEGVAVITLSNPPVNALHPAGKARGVRMTGKAAAGVAGLVVHYAMLDICFRFCSAQGSL